MDGEVICGGGKRKYFCERGWTGNQVICPSGKITHFNPVARAWSGKVNTGFRKNTRTKEIERDADSIKIALYWTQYAQQRRRPGCQRSPGPQTTPAGGATTTTAPGTTTARSLG
jgi:hypothetical protein